jgi:hypothetical protein
MSEWPRNPNDKPEPKTCPACGDSTDWIWNADETDTSWELLGEWWFGRNGRYVCSMSCRNKDLMTAVEYHAWVSARRLSVHQLAEQSGE